MTFTTVVEPEVLANRLEDPRWRVFDCRFSLADTAKGRRAYGIGHIPGAVYVHLDEDLSGDIGSAVGRHPLPDKAVFANRLGSWSISPDQQIVVYDDGNSAIAARMWWMLARWAGHPATAVLNGGYARWQKLGLAVTDAVPEPPSPSNYQWDLDDGAWITTEEIVDGSDRFFLLDARSPERFRGESEPIDPVAGHIPGAVNAPMGRNLGEDGRFLDGDRLRARFARILGERAPESTVHTCGSGVSACHNLLAMERAGLTGSRLYVGSWSEWIRDPSRPVATGD